MKRKILVTLLAFCLIASLCVVGAAASAAGQTPISTLDDLTAAATNGGSYMLTSDVTASGNITISANIELDLNGHTLNMNGHKLYVSGDMTVSDSTASVAPAIDPANDYDVTYSSGSIKSTKRVAIVSGTFTLVSGKIEVVGTGTDVALQSSGIINIRGGYVEAQEFCVLVAKNSTVNVYGGVLEAHDNAVLGGNGTDGEGGYTINVSGGTLIGRITTSGYASCGIYHPNSGAVNFSGGTIISTKGAGIVSRAGQTTVTGGEIIALGDPSFVGKVGDSNVTVSTSGIVLDLAAKYPGAEFDGTIATNADVNISGSVEISGTKDSVNVVTSNNGTNVTEDDNVVITGGSFAGSTDLSSYLPTNSALTFDENGKVVPSDDAVAEVNGVPYKTLQAAIDAAEDIDTVTLVANVDEDIAAGTPLKVEKDITIEGRSKTISLTLKNSALDSGRDKILQIVGENAKLTLNNVKLDINGFVDNANEKGACGDAIDLYLGGDLEANNSTIDIDGVAAAFVIQTKGETIKLNNTTVTADNVRGNGSQGGEWTVNNSSIRFTNCGDNAFSVETATINSSDVVVNGSGLCGIMGADISIINGSTVTVTGSGKKLPQKSIYAPNGDAYNYAVELKKNGELKVEDSTLTLSGNVNLNGAAIDNIFVSAGTTTDTANGTVNAGFVVAEGSDQLVVRMMDGNVQYSNQTVTKGDSVYLPTLSKSGYTFTGWRVNNSNTIVRGGESYPITANTTFTAVWNMIMIPDTYDIAVDQPAHGTVDVSFSNASQGSVITVTATPDEGYELVYITVDGEPISGNSFVMPDHAVEVSALFAEIGKEVNFVDVSRADWFYDYVQYVAQNGLMEGTTRTAFEPNASMTRAMFWTVLARIDGETITGDAWKTLAQTWAVESGISDGTNADALITREQMVTMLYRYAGSPVAGGMAISEFTDGASVSDYATDAVTWALSEGILTGMGDGILAPQGTATRAQAAAMLMRFVEA